MLLLGGFARRKALLNVTIAELVESEYRLGYIDRVRAQVFALDCHEIDSVEILDCQK